MIKIKPIKCLWGHDAEVRSLEKRQHYMGCKYPNDVCSQGPVRATVERLDRNDDAKGSGAHPGA